MANPGASPINTSTPVGQLRTFLGDINGVPLDPAVAGQLDYQYWSDSELTMYLAAGQDSLPRASGWAITQLATVYAMGDDESIRTDDLGLSIKGRGSSFKDIIKSYFDQADAADAAEGYFDMVPFAGTSGPIIRISAPVNADDLTESPNYPGLWS